MAPIAAAERSRLTTLGNQIINADEKQKLKSATGQPSLLQSLLLPITSNTAQKLLVLGYVLRQDGQKFAAAAEKILKTYPFQKGDEQLMRANMRNVADTWVDRQKMGQAAYNKHYESQMAKRAKATEKTYAKISHLSAQTMRAFDTWVEEELLQYSIQTEEDGSPKKACTFCGAKENKEEKVLLKCGRCMAALYCDKDCQRLSWKREHKSTCVAKTGPTTGGEGKDE